MNDGSVVIYADDAASFYNNEGLPSGVHSPEPTDTSKVSRQNSRQAVLDYIRGNESRIANTKKDLSDWKVYKT